MLAGSAEYSHSNLLKHLCREVQAGLRCYEPILAGRCQQQHLGGTAVLATSLNAWS